MDYKNKNIRWGIIGCGSVTEVKSGPAYQKVPGFTLSSVMRRDLDKSRSYAERHGVENYTNDADELIADANIDAIYIATPPNSHKEYALKVAAAGKPCCIEKPMAPSYADCVEIREAFSSKNLPLYVAYYRRSLPRFLKVKEWIDAKSIGDIRHVQWNFCKPANDIDLSQQYNWRTDANIAAGGYFDDLACHGLDLFSFLLGDIRTAHGISTNQQGFYSANDAISGCWLHSCGVTGSGSWNFCASNREDKVEIIGNQGKLRFSIFAEAPLELITANHREQLNIENPTNIQLYHAENIFFDLTGVSTHPSTGKSAAHTSWVMDKILGKI